MVSAVLIGASSCNKAKIDGKWKVDTIFSVAPGDVFNEPVLEINSAKGEYYGVTGVNSVNGDIKVGDQKVTFGSGPMTRMAADPHSMEVETAYLKALDDACTYVLEDGILYLKDCCDNTVMTLSAR